MVKVEGEKIVQDEMPRNLIVERLRRWCNKDTSLTLQHRCMCIHSNYPFLLHSLSPPSKAASHNQSQNKKAMEREIAQGIP